MAPLPAVPKVVRVDFHGKYEGDLNVQNREFFQYAGTLNLTDAATWLTAIVTAWNADVIANLSTRLSSLLAELTDLSSNTAPQVLNSTGTTGGDGNTPTSAGTALVIKKVIARRYRGGHPRVYLAGATATNIQAGGTWDPTYLGNRVGNYIAFINAATTTPGGTAIGAITHVNVSYFSGFTNHTFPSGRVHAIPTPRVTPLVDAINGHVGNPIPASQRRRNEQP